MIAKIKPEMRDVFMDEPDNYPLTEEVSFIYNKIIWSWGQEGDIVFEDVWQEAV